MLLRRRKLVWKNCKQPEQGIFSINDIIEMIDIMDIIEMIKQLFSFY